MEDNDTEQDSRLSSSVRDPQITVKGTKINPIQPSESIFETGLKDRNVSMIQEEPEPSDEIWRQIISKEHFKQTTDEDEGLWNMVLKKSAMTNEPYFQHAVMFRAMDLFEHFKKENLFDHTTEVQWSVSPPPSKTTRRLARPTPDLVVGFKPSCFLSKFQGKDLAGWKGFMMLEGDRGEDPGRAFPFLIMEVKGPSAKVGNDVLKRQVLNSASCALHSMWRFYEGENNEEDFFNNVRVFSASGHWSVFLIIVHWATRADVDSHIREGYPLGFDHKVIYEAPHLGEYSKYAVEGILQNILGYAESRLLPTLRKAVKNKLARAKAGEDGPSSLKADAEYLNMAYSMGRKRGLAQPQDNARASRSKLSRSVGPALQNSFASNGSMNRGLDGLGVDDSPGRAT